MKTHTPITSPAFRFASSEAAGHAPGPGLPGHPNQGRAAERCLAMMDTYRRSGGLVSSDEAAALLRRHREQPISLLARWIVARTVVSWRWQSQTLVPLFQFNVTDMSLHRGAAQVIGELAGVLDETDMALWFAEPNAWLANAAPVDALEFDPLAVLHAARADRYIARA